MTATDPQRPQITKRRARRRFEPGMICLDPQPDEPGVIIWTVARVTARGTTLLADYGSEQAEAQITGPDSAFVPDDWRVLEHDAIARVFSGDGQAADLDVEDTPLPTEQSRHVEVAHEPEPEPLIRPADVEAE